MIEGQDDPPQGTDVDGLTKSEIAHRAMLGTSDFPIILENIATKLLRRGYDEAPQTFAPFTARRSVPDFKEISHTQMGEAPSLLLVNEHGEFKTGAIKEGGERYAIKTFGRIVSIVTNSNVLD